jgi:hypothetical protein
MKRIARNTGWVVLGMGVLLAASGCGGGASAPASTMPVVPTRDFQPNYAQSVNDLWYWPQRDLTLHIEQGTETSTRSAVFSQACQNWKTVTQAEIRPSVTDSTDAQIKVRFVAPGSLGNAMGVTNTQAEVGSGKISTATIDIVSGLSDAELLLTLEHEFGHAFGIGGHSPDKKDVMFPAPTLGTPISLADTNTVLYAYRNLTRSAAPATGKLVTRRVE